MGDEASMLQLSLCVFCDGAVSKEYLNICKFLFPVALQLNDATGFTSYPDLAAGQQLALYCLTRDHRSGSTPSPGSAVSEAATLCSFITFYRCSNMGNYKSLTILFPYFHIQAQELQLRLSYQCPWRTSFI